MIAKILKEINERLARIERRLTTINIDGEITMASLDALTAAVAAETSVNASAIALINGFAAQLAAAGTDPAALALARFAGYRERQRVGCRCFGKYPRSRSARSADDAGNPCRVSGPSFPAHPAAER